MSMQMQRLTVALALLLDGAASTILSSTALAAGLQRHKKSFASHRNRRTPHLHHRGQAHGHRPPHALLLQKNKRALALRKPAPAPAPPAPPPAAVPLPDGGWHMHIGTCPGASGGARFSCSGNGSSGRIAMTE
mmetsp:Transcript_13218/g.32263  ORF Transcript_13218/g.32263 Transcript_13218/m.32263 type:complete len:133 (-) Transcript_13218:497-895(-)